VLTIPCVELFGESRRLVVDDSGIKHLDRAAEATSSIDAAGVKRGARLGLLGYAIVLRRAGIPDHMAELEKAVLGWSRYCDSVYSCLEKGMSYGNALMAWTVDDNAGIVDLFAGIRGLRGQAQCARLHARGAAERGETVRWPRSKHQGYA